MSSELKTLVEIVLFVGITFSVLSWIVWYIRRRARSSSHEELQLTIERNLLEIERKRKAEKESNSSS